jgi:hypothetical protein
VFQQQEAHALYGEYNTQWLNTAILLYQRGAWGLVIGYLAPLKGHVPQEGKLSGYIFCNISDLLCNKESD